MLLLSCVYVNAMILYLTEVFLVGLNRDVIMSADITIKDIARLAGVSIGTVDRTIHSRGRVAEKTAERIRNIIRDTGYEPNLHASNLAKTKTNRIGILLPREEQDSGFWKLPRRGIHQAMKDLAPFRIHPLVHTFDRFSDTSFNTTAEALLREEPEGILLAPVLPGPAEEFLRSLPTDIPLCCFDTDLPTHPKPAFIGQDPYMSGKLAGKFMRLLTADTGTSVIIQPVKADFHIHQRIRGFRTMYSDTAEPPLCQEETLDTEKGVFRFMEDLLRSIPDIKGIFVINASVFRIAEHLMKIGREDIGLIGYDLIPENIKYLKEGIIDFLISQRPELQAYRGILRLFQEINGMTGGVEGEERETMPIDILTKENVEYYSPFPQGKGEINPKMKLLQG